MNNIPLVCLVSMIILFCIAGFFFVQRCNTKTLEAFTSQVVTTSTETDTGNVYIFDKTLITRWYSEENKNIKFELIRHTVKERDDLKIQIKYKDNNEIYLDIDNPNIVTVDNNSLIIGIKDTNELDQLDSITVTVIKDRPRPTTTPTPTTFKCSSINLYNTMPRPNKTEQISTLHSKCKSGGSSCVVHNSILDSTTKEEIILDKCVDTVLDTIGDSKLEKMAKRIKPVYCPTSGIKITKNPEFSQCNLAKPHCSIIKDTSGFKCVDSSAPTSPAGLVSIIECNTKLNKNNKPFSYSLNRDTHRNLLKYYGDYSGTLENFITKLNGTIVEHTITKNGDIIQYQDNGGNQTLLKNVNIDIRNKKNEENKEIIFTIDTDANIEDILPPFFIHYIDSDISEPTTSSTIIPSSSSVSVSSQSINPLNPLISTTVSLEVTNPAGLPRKSTSYSHLPTLPTIPTSFTTPIETSSSSNNIPSFSAQSTSSTSIGSIPSVTDPFVGSMERNNNNNNKPQINHFFDLNTSSDISKNLNKLEEFYGGPVPTVSQPIVQGITPNMGARINHPQLDNSILN